jgi:dipicolinate synthase subunit A
MVAVPKDGPADGWLTGVTVAVVGGDRREQEIARLAAQAGASVRAYGFPWPAGGIVGVACSSSAAEALDGADYALFPVAGIAADGSLYAPGSPRPIIPDASLLKLLKPAAVVVLGRADEKLRRAAKEVGVALEEYEDDAELMLLRAPAVAEGVVALAIANTDVTIHGSRVGVVGYGTIGTVLSRALVALGAEAHVFARNRAQRAAAYAATCRPHPLEDLPVLAADLAMLFSTVPVPLVGRDVLRAMVPGSLVVDLAAPPGSVDLAAGEQLGLKALWARGMGASAPVTAGRSQWRGIAQRIARHEAERRLGRNKERATS